MDRTDPQRMTGLEAAQLRALADALADADPDATVALTLTDAGVVHARVHHPDGRTTWCAITTTAEVLPALGPADGVER